MGVQEGSWDSILFPLVVSGQVQVNGGKEVAALLRETCFFNLIPDVA